MAGPNNSNITNLSAVQKNKKPVRFKTPDDDNKNIPDALPTRGKYKITSSDHYKKDRTKLTFWLKQLVKYFNFNLMPNKDKPIFALFYLRDQPEK
jgi:hypothetical protein